LAFEAGVNSGNHHDSEYRWECDKYYFEKDIERLSNE